MILKKFFEVDITFWKDHGNVRKHREIKLLTTGKREKLFGIIARPSYKNIFSEVKLATEMKKISNTHEKTCLFRTSNPRSK